MKSSFVLSVLVGALLVAGCRHEDHPEPSGEAKVNGETISFPAGSPELASLGIAAVESRTPNSTQLSGRLVWNEDMTVRVFTPFAGRVRKITAELGQAVERNAPLAEIESPEFGQAQADVQKAESDLKLAEHNLVRLRDLFAHGAAPQKDVEAAEDAQAQTQAEHSRALSKIAVYGANADSPDEIFVLRSPISGTVVDKNITPGREIRPDQMLANIPEITAPLFVISAPEHLWIQIDATEIDLPHFQPGREFTFTSHVFPDETFTGRVEKVAEFIDPSTRTIKVRGSVDNPRHLLKAEMFVNVNLPDDGAANLSVPAPAVFLNGEKHFVFVQDKAGQFTRREVAIGAEQAGRVFILSGLQAGQQVVTDGCIFLQQLLGE